MKKFSKLFMVVACLAMVFCFSAGAFAAVDTADSVNVTLNLQEADRSVSPVDVTEIDTIEFEALSTDTLKTALDKAVADKTNNLTAVEWKDVPVVDENYEPTGEIAQVLESLTYNGKTYENKATESTPNTYKGNAWSYFYGIGATPASSWDYPVLYLSQVSVADLASYGNGFTLSYEYSEMSW